MERREFSHNLAAAGTVLLCGGGPAAATQKERDGRSGFPQFGRIKLLVERQVLLPRKMLVVSRNDAVEIGLDRVLPVSNENRSSILNPTLARQFRGGVNIGEVRADGRGIFVSTDLPLVIGELHIADEDVSFAIPGAKLVTQRDAPVPLLRDIPLIGALFRRKNDSALKRSLLILVRAEILDVEE